MKVSKFSEQHSALILKQVDDGLSIEESVERLAVAGRPFTGGARSTAACCPRKLDV